MLFKQGARESRSCVERSVSAEMGGARFPREVNSIATEPGSRGFTT